ncbi:hypothetical protein COCOBI_13-3910 [Coccomyxa sp. Obi]|nr:hypothetical protein COCOBI_13-3910 [Coccomyxa sp. Obi]
MQVAGRNTLGVSDVVKTLTIHPCSFGFKHTQQANTDVLAIAQVGVPSSHASNPVIIVKLLEVRLDAGQQGTAQRPGGSSQGGSGSRAAASQALEWGPSDAMEGPRGSSGGLGAPQHSQQRADPKEDASRIIEDILTRNTEEEGPRGGPASGRRGDHHPGFGRAAYSTAPMFSQQPMSRAQLQHSRGLPEMQVPRGAREQYLGGEGFPGSPPQRAAAQQQQMDSFGRYQQRHHEQPQQQPQQQQQVHTHGHGMAAHARSPEGPSPGARAAALALGPGAGLRLQSPEGLLAHAHMSTLDSPPRLSYADSAEHQYQQAAQHQQHPQQSQRMLFQQPPQQQQGRHSYSQFEAARYFLPPDELPQRGRADAREVAAQSSPDDVWACMPGRPGGQMSGQLGGQPGAFRGFDFASERSMLHTHELTAAHAESGGRKRPAEQEGGGGGGRGGPRGPLLDPKAVLGGQGWKLQRVRSLGSLPSDEALLAQAARWPDRRSRPRQEAEASQQKPVNEETTKGAQAEAAATESHVSATEGVPSSTPMPAAQNQATETGQERSAQPSSRGDAPQPPPAAAAAPASAPLQDPPPPATAGADPPVAPSGSAGGPGLQPLRIEPLNLDAAAAEAEPYSSLGSSHVQAGGHHQEGVVTAGNAASPLSHGSLNAFNPFEGGSEFTLSPLRRGGDNRGDTAGGQGSPAAHSGYNPFGLVSDLGFTPDH